MWGYVSELQIDRDTKINEIKLLNSREELIDFMQTQRMAAVKIYEMTPVTAELQLQLDARAVMHPAVLRGGHGIKV